jgi:hypothetical protein
VDDDDANDATPPSFVAMHDRVATSTTITAAAATYGADAAGGGFLPAPTLPFGLDPKGLITLLAIVAVFACVAYAFVRLMYKHGRYVVHLVETSIYLLFAALRYPVRVLGRCVRHVAYPVKESCLDTCNAVHLFYYPAERRY